MKTTMKKLTVLFLLAVLTVAALTGCGAKSVSVAVEPFISISFRGMDGEGTAAPAFAYVDFEKAVMSGWSEKEQTWEKLAALTKLESTISCAADKTENLRNGDKVKITVSYDKDLAKELGVSFKDLSETFTVEGLKEAILVDPFDTAVFGTEAGVNVRLDGIAPFASLSIENHCSADQPQSKIKYSADITRNLKNGDSVTITASLSADAEREGYTLTRTETVYQAAGLDSQVSDVSQLLPEDVDKLRSKLEDHFFRNVVPNWIAIQPEGSGVYAYGGFTASPDSSTVSNFGFEQNGWARVDDHGSACVLVPFHFDLEMRNVNWVGTQYYDPAITVNYSVHGLYKVSGLTLDGDTGSVNSENIRIELDACYEVENELLERIEALYDSETTFAGTFVK